ncbi:M4 family metallopeptidase [Pseudonocardia hispaniensis]|uniref:M4 family metallopeptidase n=1 Tax=Pseudonocardia hispaniensis TaxID=904933 RepID=A0ABW1IZD1_9PSEU
MPDGGARPLRTVPRVGASILLVSVVVAVFAACTTSTVTPPPPGFDRYADLPAPIRAIAQRLEATGGSPLTIALDRGVVSHVAGRLPVPATALAADPPDQAKALLSDVRDLFPGTDPDLDLRPVDTRAGPGGLTTVVLQRLAGTVPVLGSEVRVTLDGAGTALAVTAALPPSAPPPPVPLLPPAQAQQAAVAAVAADPEAPAGASAPVPGEPTQVVFDAGLFEEDAPPEPPRPAWQVPVTTSEPPRAQQVIVDADTGEVLASLDDLTDLADRIVRDAGQSGDLTAIERFRTVFTGGRAVPGQHPDAEATAVHDHLGTIMTFFADRFGRDGITGRGDPVVAVVHFSTTARGAHYSRTQQRVILQDGYVTLDIVAHEYTHGVVAETADLAATGSPAALNESIADVFAELVENDGQWVIAEDLAPPAVKRGPIRSLRDPSAFGHPTQASEYIRDDDPTARAAGPQAESYRAHRNNGIMNYAAYLLATGGTHVRSGIVVPGGIGPRKLGELWYQTLLSSSRSTKLRAWAANAVATCRFLATGTIPSREGMQHRDCGLANAAFHAVGLSAPDTDLDGWVDGNDNCPTAFNPDQAPCDAAATTTTAPLTTETTTETTTEPTATETTTEPTTTEPATPTTTEPATPGVQISTGRHNFAQQDVDCTFSPAPRLVGDPGSFTLVWQPDGTITGTLRASGSGSGPVACSGGTAVRTWRVEFTGGFSGRVVGGRLADTIGTISGHSDIVLSNCADTAGRQFECPTHGPAGFTHEIHLQGSYDVTTGGGSGTYSFPAADLPTSGEWYVE